MLREKCRKDVKEVGISKQHCFSGYGFFVIYHPECCPKECDGTICELNHPENEEKSNDQNT